MVVHRTYLSVCNSPSPATKFAILMLDDLEFTENLNGIIFFLEIICSDVAW